MPAPRHGAWEPARADVCFDDGDRDIYCDMLAEQMHKASVAVWSYCLMPNHVHLILCR